MALPLRELLDERELQVVTVLDQRPQGRARVGQQVLAKGQGIGLALARRRILELEVLENSSLQMRDAFSLEGLGVNEGLSRCRIADGDGESVQLDARRVARSRNVAHDCQSKVVAMLVRRMALLGDFA